METSDVPFPAPRKQHVIQQRHEFVIVSPQNHSIATATIMFVNGILLLTNVWTDPDHRRKGMADALMTEVIKVYGDQDIWLNVNGYTDQPLDTNRLRKWYESYGFVWQNESGNMKRPRGGNDLA